MLGWRDGATSPSRAAAACRVIVPAAGAAAAVTQQGGPACRDSLRAQAFCSVVLTDKLASANRGAGSAVRFRHLVAPVTQRCRARLGLARAAAGNMSVRGPCPTPLSYPPGFRFRARRFNFVAERPLSPRSRFRCFRCVVAGSETPALGLGVFVFRRTFLCCGLRGWSGGAGGPCDGFHQWPQLRAAGCSRQFPSEAAAGWAGWPSVICPCDRARAGRAAGSWQLAVGSRRVARSSPLTHWTGLDWSVDRLAWGPPRCRCHLRGRRPSRAATPAPLRPRRRRPHPRPRLTVR